MNTKFAQRQVCAVWVTLCSLGVEVGEWGGDGDG